MTNPITPPPGLIDQLKNDALHGSRGQYDYESRLVMAGYVAGANQELEACVAWLDDTDCEDPQEASLRLRWHRRPKPPSLKEQALARTDAILNDPNRALLVEVREALELNRRALQTP